MRRPFIPAVVLFVAVDAYARFQSPVRAAAPIAGREFDVELEFLGEAFPQRGKCPVSTISTLSPGESVFTIAASHAPVPDSCLNLNSKSCDAPY